MAQAHLKALKKRHADLEDKIHRETTHAARDEHAIRRLKEQKLIIKEQISRMQTAE